MMKKFKLWALVLTSALLSSCKTSSSITSIDQSSTDVSEITSQTSAQDSETTSITPSERVITWYGIADISIPLGDEFDLLEGVRAVDSIDGELEVVVLDDDYFDYNYDASFLITYQAQNSVGTKSTKYRNVQVEKGPNVLNGSFTLGKSYWRFDAPGATGTFAISNEAAVISITDAGAEAWSAQLYQTGLRFTQGKTYEMTFKAKSVSGRSVSAGFEDVSNNYAMLIPGYPAKVIDSEYSTYSAIYTATEDFGAIKAVIYLGRGLDIDSIASRTQPIDVTIDDIKIKEITVAPAEKRPVFTNAGAVTVTTGDQFAALPEVTAKDYLGKDITDKIIQIGAIPSSIAAETRMLVSYRVTDDEGNFNFINRAVYYRIAKANVYNLINSDFDNGFQGWIRDVNQTAGKGVVEFVDNADSTVSAKITTDSSDNWHIQLYQSNVTLEAGKIYRTTLVAKANIARNLTIEISNPATSYSRLATELVSLTTEWQTYVMEFKASVSASAKVALLLAGQGTSQVDIDYFENIMISAEEATKIDPRTYSNYQLINNDFKYGFYGWTRESNYGADINFSEDRDNEAVILEVEANGTANWHAQINQDGRKFEASVTYTLTLEAYSLSATTITMEVTNNNGETKIADKNVTLTSTMATYTLEFTPVQTYSLGKVSLLIGTSAITTITVSTLTVTK